MNDTVLPAGARFTRERVIQLLNQDLASEVHAMLAFRVYSQMLRRASYTDTARELERHAAEDYQHAKSIVEQIELLGGKPCLTPGPEDVSDLMRIA